MIVRSENRKVVVADGFTFEQSLKALDRFSDHADRFDHLDLVPGLGIIAPRYSYTDLPPLREFR